MTLRKKTKPKNYMDNTLKPKFKTCTYTWVKEWLEKKLFIQVGLICLLPGQKRTTLMKDPFENLMRKGENVTFYLVVLKCFHLDQLKIMEFGERITVSNTQTR